MSQHLPAFFRQMRHHRLAQPDEAFQRLPFGPAGLIGRGAKAANRIGQLIELRHSGIEMESLNRLCHALDGLVRALAQLDGLISKSVRRVCPGGRQVLGPLADLAPDALGVTPGAFDAAFGPVQVALRRAVGEHVPTGCIGPVTIYDIRGVDRVPL